MNKPYVDRISFSTLSHILLLCQLFDFNVLWRFLCFYQPNEAPILSFRLTWVLGPGKEPVSPVQRRRDSPALPTINPMILLISASQR